MAQPSSYRDIVLLDASEPRSHLVDAIIYRDYPAEALVDVEMAWSETRRRQAAQLSITNDPQWEHAHWDWRNKYDSVKSRKHVLIVIESRHDGQPQGLMACLRIGKPSRLGLGSVLYIDYLESAPWNLRSQLSEPRFLGVGTQLISEAIRLSIDSGYDGAIGLHSLPQAEAFYADKLGMTYLENDPAYYDLAYYEFDAPTALRWLESVGGQP